MSSLVRKRTYIERLYICILRHCVVVKKLTKEHHIYIHNTDKALEICNDLNETNKSRIKYQNISKANKLAN